MTAIGTTAPGRERRHPDNLRIAELEHGVDSAPVEALDQAVDRLQPGLPPVLAGELCELLVQQGKQGQ